MRKRTLVGWAIASIAIAAPVRSQVVVETQSSWDGSSIITAFGFSAGNLTDAYGQTFTAPAQYLNSWSFWLSAPDGDASSQMFTANVGTWTGTEVGSILWTSALTGGTNSVDPVQYTWNTGGVSLLTGGQSYIFFLDAVSGSGILGMGWINNSAGVYADGRFEFNNGTNHFVAWDSFFGQGYDVAFRAEFDRVPGGPGSTVPEPATMTLLATGLAGMAAARKRKRNA